MCACKVLQEQEQPGGQWGGQQRMLSVFTESPGGHGKVWHRVKGQHFCLAKSFPLTVETTVGYSHTQVGDRVGGTADRGNSGAGR